MAAREYEATPPSMAGGVDAAYGAGLDTLLAGIVADEAVSGGDEDEGAEAAQEAAVEEPAEEQAEEAAEPEEGDDGAEADEEGGEPDVSPEVQRDVDRAKQNLRLVAKVPQDVLDQMEPEAVLAWWQGVSTQKAETDRAFEERAELKKRLEGLEATNDGERDDAVPTLSADHELPKEVADELGTEASGALARHLAARDRAAQEAIAPLRAFVQELLVERAWDKLREDGKLGDEQPEGAFERVVGRAEQLAKSDGEWTGKSPRAFAEALLAAAARLELPDAPTDAELTRRASASRAKRKGTATPARAKKAPKRKLSDDERYEAKAQYIIDELGKGGDSAAVAERAAQLYGYT